MNTQPKHVCIQGIGFVGAATAVAVAHARAENGSFRYQVTGVDRDTPQGRERVEALRRGVFPFPTADSTLRETLARAHQEGNLSATTDESVYESADIVVIDVELDILFQDEQPQLQMRRFEEAVRAIARRIPEGALVLVETTVPPGTCEKIVAPILGKALRQRGLGEQAVYLAHSFERVMPGEKYLESITHFWRVYAGATNEAADVCETFLSSIVDVERFPLTRLSTMTASETTKVMENTYRAVNIALIDEWTKYAEVVGIDLYEVIDAIRVRPTHSNIRVPGLGVGGYCLPKDPAFTPAAVRQLFNIESLDFPFSRLAMQVNQAMPTHAFERLEELLDSELKDKSILLLGISYRQDVGDTRYSPVESLVRALETHGAHVMAFDPYLEYWPEMDRPLPNKLPDANKFDAVVISTPHTQFFELDLLTWLGNAQPVILDTVNTISKRQRQRCRAVGIRIESVGRGSGL